MLKMRISRLTVPPRKMDNSRAANRRNKFWFVCLAFFGLWYVLLYGVDWSSVPGLTSISRYQAYSLKLLGSDSIHTKRYLNVNASSKVSVDEIRSNVSRNASSKFKNGDIRSNVSRNAISKVKAGDIRSNVSRNVSSKVNVGDIIRSNVSRNAISKVNVGGIRSNVSRKATNVTDGDKNFDKKSSGNDVVKDSKGVEKELEPFQRQNVSKDERHAIVRKGRNMKSCAGRYIYIHKLPSRFNDDLLKQCKLLSKWNNMCQNLVNMGLGPDLRSPRLFMSSGWFTTHQFSLEIIFHNRMKQYECLTNDSSKAAAMYVPYYAGLDVGRYLWDSHSISKRDAASLDVVKWLRSKPEWKRMWGRDHFMVAGRITWDFRRGVDKDSAWGNKLMLLPEAQNMTMLTIESSPWNRNDFAIPYPTYFHPWSDAEVFKWQKKMRRARRRTLFSFVGGSRPNLEDDIRGEIMKQCLASRRKCKLLECKNKRNKCSKPMYVMKMFQTSIFCLQPPGDSFTRRSTFDSILAGCIPVVFSPASAYVQYLWHLPRDHTNYSVLISEDDVKAKRVNIEHILSAIPRSKVSAMKEEVIKLIPKVIYADPRSRLEKLEDAFDLTVKGVIERTAALRKEIREGKSTSFSFNEESSWKYYTFGTVEKHEWDHFFRRTDKIKY